MADNNNQNGQDATQQFINILKSFKWRIIGFLAFLIIAILFLTRILEDNFNYSVMFNRNRYRVY